MSEAFHLKRVGRLVLLASWLLSSLLAGAEPYLPRDGGEVLERLGATRVDRSARALREMRQRLTTDRTNQVLAAQLARQCLARGRVEADPRYLGQAQAALEPWWEDPRPPEPLLLLRGTIKQSRHDFTNALADLDLALTIAPHDPQAWLTKSIVLTVLGRYAEARRACFPLARLAPGLIAVSAAAAIASLNGNAESSCLLLKRALEDAAGAGSAEQLWGWTILAESRARLGRAADAESAFQKALALGSPDPYLLGAYADFLIDQGQFDRAIDLLRNQTRADALLLRVAMAESWLQPRPTSFISHRNALRERFEFNRRRGDTAHRREEALFALHVLGDATTALALAQANWQVQREPADVRLLLESALAARDPVSARPAVDFVTTNRLEDWAATRSLHSLADLEPR